MRPIFSLISAMSPYCTGLLTIYIMYLIVEGNSFPLGVVLGVIFYALPIYCFFVLPFYGGVYHIGVKYTRGIFAMSAPLVVFIQGFIVSIAMHIPLLSDPMINFIFPLFSIMMLTFVCCLFLFKEHTTNQWN